MKSKIIYLTYQTFPSDTANTIQTIDNAKYICQSGHEIIIVFPLRSKFSSDNYFFGLSPDHIFYTYAPYFGKFQSGKIGLQDHGWSVRFKNIKIKEL